MAKCECGCDLEAGIASKDRPERGYKKGDSRRFIRGHYKRATGTRTGRPITSAKSLYRRIGVGKGETKPEHILIAERVLGKTLPHGVQVHHVNEIRLDNNHKNLVICESAAYHKLLHKRQDALNACGHADWIKCRFCKQYDDPANPNMRNGKGGNHHLECFRKYKTDRREK